MAAQFRDYWDLTKPRVVSLIVFTALVGMFLAIPSMPSVAQVQAGALGFLGIWLAAAAAAAINQLLDAKTDAQMARTSWRPLVVGKIRPVQVLVFASVLMTLSMTILIVWVNLMTAVLTFASLIGYAVIYTVYLKRMTSQNIVIGGLAGAMPPMLGWAAVTGLSTVEDWVNASLLVAIIFVWTPPHFWALAIFRRADYAKASIPMLPVTHGVQHTRRQIFLYTVILSIVTLLPVATRMSGIFYLGGAVVLDAVFIWYAWRMLDPPDEFFAMKMFGYSVIYLMSLFAFLMFDHWLRLANIG
ncbi:MAG TPA: heme o synthase [Xylella sp.]